MATFNEKILFLQTKREKAPLMATFLNIYSKEELENEMRSVSNREGDIGNGASSIW